jgi:hypothetical protein
MARPVQFSRAVAVIVQATVLAFHVLDMSARWLDC